MKIKDKARLYRELAKLLGASFPMDKSIAMLLGQQPSSGRRAFLEGLRQGFAGNLGFSEAMRIYNRDLATGLELNLIESGERSGRLAEACQHLAHYFETWDKGIRAARGAMVYPLVLLHMGIIIPEIVRQPLLNSMGKETHAAPAILWRLVIFWALLLILRFVWRSLSRRAATDESTDRLLNLLPLIGSVRQHWALARFCQVFHSGLLAAMRISECLCMAGEASQSGILLKGGTQAAADLELGRTLTEAMEFSRSFPRHFVTSIATAEAAGGLDTEMARWATAETDYAAEAQKNAAELYPKALYFCVVAYVGWRVVAFFMDYYGSMQDMLH